MNTQGETMKNAYPASTESCRSPFHAHLARRWQSAAAGPLELALVTPRPYVNGQTAWLLAPLHTGRLQRQRSLLGGGLVIAGAAYAHGLSVRSPNRVEVHSAVPMTRLDAVIGVDAAAPEPHGMRFNVKPGNHWIAQKVYEGQVLERGQPGQRIDIEVLRRSFPLWRSDTQCFPPAIPTLDQAQTAGLSRFVPQHAAGMWGVDPYTARSVATGGFSLCIDPDDHAACPPAELAARMAEVRELRDCWLGDFHALTPITVDESRWMAWQLNRPDLGRGFAMAFRRPQATAESLHLGLRGLEPQGLYRVRHHDAGWTREMRGAELAALTVTLPALGSCALISYRRLP